MKSNPKLFGSNLIDCVPHIGDCPLQCLDCYYNLGFYRSKDEPLIPTLQEVGDKIVRVNSGHDSAIDKEHVIWITRHYKKKFYNTSKNDTNFPAPVVVTVNGRNPDKDFIKLTTKQCKNTMAVRIKVNTWNINLVDKIVNYYTKKNVPMLLTFMRYTLPEHLQLEEDYEVRKSIIHNYYCITPDAFHDKIEPRYLLNILTFFCGAPNGPKVCKDCGNCQNLFYYFYK